MSQKVLAPKVGYTSSYISKVEKGAIKPSRDFAENSDRQLRAGGALVRRWKDYTEVERGPRSDLTRDRGPTLEDPAPDSHSTLVVEHEDATLTYEEGVFRTRVRRQIRNIGTEPVTQYLIRISVDRYPGDPERSNRLYREHPLTWEEISLSATCDGEPMSWRVVHDRDAFKELWLLFESRERRFPLYPGQSAWLDYTYTVGEDKWGPWWKRAIRLPTKRLSLCVDLPTALRPVVWGMETSMTAEAFPLRTPVSTEELGDRTRFTWGADNPPLHARYRLEWKFQNQRTEQPDSMSPAKRMEALGIVQRGDPVLTTTAKSFDLPTEAEDARRIVSELVSTMERVAGAWTFAKGMGLAAPQVGIGRAAAVVRAPGDGVITLLNPRIVEQAAEQDEQYEGCLSFFDVRCMVPRPVTIHVEHQDVHGSRRITVFERGLARLVAHEVDHLRGTLCLDRLPPGVAPIPISQYQGTGQSWRYG